MLLVSVLATDIIPTFNMMTYGNNNNINMSIETNTRSESYESYLQYKPLLQYNIGESFNGSDKFIDISSDVEDVKNLDNGTVAIKFKTSSVNQNNTLFSISDKNSTNSYFEVKLLNGQIRLETKDNGSNVMSYTAQNKNFADGKYHTLCRWRNILC